DNHGYTSAMKEELTQLRTSALGNKAREALLETASQGGPLQPGRILKLDGKPVSWNLGWEFHQRALASKVEGAPNEGGSRFLYRRTLRGVGEASRLRQDVKPADGSSREGRVQGAVPRRTDLQLGSDYSWSALARRFGFRPNYLSVAGGMVPVPSQ